MRFWKPQVGVGSGRLGGFGFGLCGLRFRPSATHSPSHSLSGRVREPASPSRTVPSCLRGVVYISKKGIFAFLVQSHAFKLKDSQTSCSPGRCDSRHPNSSAVLLVPCFRRSYAEGPDPYSCAPPFYPLLKTAHADTVLVFPSTVLRTDACVIVQDVWSFAPRQVQHLQVHAFGVKSGMPQESESVRADTSEK